MTTNLGNQRDGRPLLLQMRLDPTFFAVSSEAMVPCRAACGKQLLLRVGSLSHASLGTCLCEVELLPIGTVAETIFLGGQSVVLVQQNGLGRFGEPDTQKPGI